MRWGKLGTNWRPASFSYSFLTDWEKSVHSRGPCSPPLLAVVMNKTNRVVFFSLHIGWFCSPTGNFLWHSLNRPISAQNVRLGVVLLWCQMTPFEGSGLVYQCVLSFSLQYSATFDSFAPGNHILLVHGDLPPYPDILIRCGSRLGQSLLSPPLPSRDRGCDWFFNSQSGRLTYLGMCLPMEVCFEGT